MWQLTNIKFLNLSLVISLQAKKYQCHSDKQQYCSVYTLHCLHSTCRYILSCCSAEQYLETLNLLYQVLIDHDLFNRKPERLSVFPLLHLQNVCSIL